MQINLPNKCRKYANIYPNDSPGKPHEPDFKKQVYSQS